MRLRAWRITMWTSLAATVLLAGAAIGTRGGWSAMLGGVGAPNGVYAVVERGCLYCGEGYFNGFALPGPVWVSFDRYNGGYGRRWTLGVSLWLPAGAALSLTAFSVWRLRRARLVPGLCPRCGYARVGLPTDAPCPECGKERKA